MNTVFKSARSRRSTAWDKESTVKTSESTIWNGFTLVFYL